MANTVVSFHEVRFDVRDPSTTHVYVYIDAKPDAPHMIQGWHHKAFPAPMTLADVWDHLTKGEDTPMMWARLSPPDVLASEAGQLAKAILTWDMGMDISQPGWAYWEGLRMLAEGVIGERRNFVADNEKH